MAGLPSANANTDCSVPLVVVESPASEANKVAMFPDIEARLAGFADVRAWNQKI